MINLNKHKKYISLLIPKWCLLAMLWLPLSGCNTMADLEREMSIVVELDGQEGVGGTGVDRSADEGQEGIGGSGLDPDVDGIGGTGIIGVVMKLDDLTVGGIQIPPSTDVAVFVAGAPSTISQLVEGQIAAVFVDAGNQIQQIHVFTADSGPPVFLGEVGQLIIRGEIAQFADSGIRVPDAIASEAKPGQTVQVQATAISSGVFRVLSVEPVNFSTLQTIPTITAPPAAGTKIQSVDPAGQTKTSSTPQSSSAPVTPIQPAQPTISAPPVTQLPPVTTTPEPVQPVRAPKIDLVAPVSAPVATAPQLPAIDAPDSSVQPVIPPLIAEPPVVVTSPGNPKLTDSPIGIMQPADTTVTRP